MKLPPNRTRRNAPRRGAAMLMVIVALIFATVLSVTFLVSQSPNNAIAKNVRDHARARLIAESGLTTAIAYVRESDDWRSAQSDGYWLADQDFEGGSFRVLFEDEDGNLNDDTDDPVTITVIGEFGGVSHRVSAKVTPGEDASGGNRLLYIAGDSTPNDRDQRTIDLIESWGYTVTVIDDSDTQSTYDTAVASADVIYISEECSSGAVAGKIDDVSLGVVVEETYLHDSFGFTSGNSNKSTDTQLDIVDDSHPITDGLSLGVLTVASQSTHMPRIGSSLAPGAQVLAERVGGGGDAALVVFETGAERRDGTSSPARRVALCFSNDSFDPAHLNSTGEDLMRRCIAWAAADSSEPDAAEPQQLVLYEFNEVPIMPGLVGHWKLDEKSSGGVLASNGKVHLKNNSVVDAYDSSAGAYGDANKNSNAVVATNSTASKRIEMENNADLYGSAYAGVGGNPNTVIDTANQATITGSTGALSAPIATPASIAAPTGMPANEGDYTVKGNETFNSDRQFDDLDFKNNSVLTIEGDVTVLVNGELEIRNNVEIVLAEGASLRLYVDDAVEIRQNVEINADSTRPGDLSLYVMSDEQLKINNNVVMAGTIRAAGDVEIKNGVELFGNLIAQGEVVLQQTALLHLDANLPGVGGIYPPAADASDHENNGEFFNGPTLEQGGAIPSSGTSVGFDGNDDYAVIPHDDAYLLDAGALSLWFRTEDKNKDQSVFSKDHLNLGTGGHLTVLIDGGAVKTRLQSTSQTWNLTAAAPIQNDTWHHMVFTWGPNKMRLYLDGQEIGDPFNYIGGTGATSGDIGNYEPIVLGADTRWSDPGLPTPLKDFFQGQIDDVRLYDQALDANQVDNLAAGSDPGPSSFPGYLVEDTSGFGAALDLIVQDTDAIAWPDGGGLMFTDDTIALSIDPATKVHDAIAATGSFTLEAVFTPDNLAQNGPARIVSYSESTSSRNFTLGQDGDAYAFRLRTTDTGSNGTPDIASPDDLDVAEQHVVITANGQTVNLYRNGELEHTEDRAGSFNWDHAMHLMMGGEADDSRNWRGLLSRIAIYDRALAPSQVDNLFNGLPPGDATGNSEFKVIWTEEP